MRAYSIIAAAAVAVGASVPATAQNWVQYGSNARFGMTAYYDPDRVRRTGDIALIWSRFNNDPGKIPGESYRVFLEEIDCRNEMGRTRFITVYGADGRVVRTDNRSDQMEPLIPGTMADTLRELACA